MSDIAHFFTPVSDELKRFHYSETQFGSLINTHDASGFPDLTEGVQIALIGVCVKAETVLVIVVARTPRIKYATTFTNYLQENSLFRWWI